MDTIELAFIYDGDNTPPSVERANALLKRDRDPSRPLDPWPLVLDDPLGAVTVEPAQAPELNRFQLAHARLDDEQMARAMAATRALNVTITAGADELPMAALARGLRTIRPLLEGFVAVFDPHSTHLHPGHWGQAVADAPVPPRPEALFALHAVGDADGPRWIHSHGLARFGLPELEVLEAPAEHANELGHLVGAVAARLLLEGVPDEGDVTLWGNNVAAALVPWDQVSELAVTGGDADDRDDAHAPSNRVLVVPTDAGWASVATQVPAWGEHPVFYRTDWETHRMEALARARWPLMVLLHGAVGDDDRFRFLAKLGYGPDGGYREHLWFDLVQASSYGLNATLLNEPHQDLGMHAGDRADHDVDRLSDFVIYTPIGSFDPESLPQLAAWVQGQLG